VIRLVFLLRRLADTSLEEFQTYWRDQHAPLVASHQMRLGILRYTQSHRIEDPVNGTLAAARGGMEEPYDGVAELWFQSEEAMIANANTEDGRRAARELLEDERAFIDLASSPLWVAHEYPQVNPAPEDIVARPNSPIVKLHFPLRHRADMSPEDARRYWLVQHGPLVRWCAVARGLLRYQQVHRFESPVEDALRKGRGTVTEPYLGHAEAWFDRTLPRQTPEAREAGRLFIEDESKFIDFARSAIWLGKELVIVDRW
jgi:uncharacterized protein (TIGR02118 family)